MSPRSRTGEDAPVADLADPADDTGAGSDGAPETDLEGLLDLPPRFPWVRLHRIQALDAHPSNRPPDAGDGVTRLRGVPGPARGGPRRGQRALQHPADQRHGLLPGSGDVGGAGGACRAANWSIGHRRNTRSRLERRVRVRSGAVLDRHAVRRGTRRRGATGTGQGLCDRHRRRCPGDGPAGLRTRPARWRRSRPTCSSATSRRSTWRSTGPRLRCGPASLRDLRTPQPRQRRPDLPRRPAPVPQHADVLQLRPCNGRWCRRIHFSLSPKGYLVLGKVEMLLGHRSLFHLEDGPVRIFSRLSQADVRRNDLRLLQTEAADVADAARSFRRSPSPRARLPLRSWSTSRDV